MIGWSADREAYLIEAAEADNNARACGEDPRNGTDHSRADSSPKAAALTGGESHSLSAGVAAEVLP